MLRRPISNTLRSSPAVLFTRATAQQTRLHDERPAPPAAEQKHGLNVQPEQSQRDIMEKAESSMFTETRGQKTEPEEEFKNTPVIGMQDERGGSMPFVYPPVWNSFGAFVGA